MQSVLPYTRRAERNFRAILITRKRGRNVYRTLVRRGLSAVAATAVLGVLGGGTAVAADILPPGDLPILTAGSIDLGYCDRECPEEPTDPLGLFWIFDLGSSFIGS